MTMNGFVAFSPVHGPQLQAPFIERNTDVQASEGKSLRSRAQKVQTEMLGHTMRLSHMDQRHTTTGE